MKTISKAANTANASDVAAIKLGAAIIDCISAEEVLDKAWEALEGKEWTRKIVEIVASAFVSHYHCKVSFANDESISPQFFTGAKYSREVRHDGAYKQWARKVTAHLEHKSSNGTQPLDAVSAVIKYIDAKKLTKAQKAKVAAYLA